MFGVGAMNPLLYSGMGMGMAGMGMGMGMMGMGVPMAGMAGVSSAAQFH